MNPSPEGARISTASTAPQANPVVPTPENKSEVSRSLASLALTWLDKGERLNVREREELRRAVSVAAKVCDWRTLGDDAMQRASKDLVKLARSGERALRRDLEDEIAAKKAEPRELKRALRDLTEQAERGDFEEPLEFTHTHTVRRPSSGLVTHTETLELKDAAEATKAAETIESRLPKWTELQKEMLEELRDRDRKLADASKRMPDFVAFAASLVRHVLATLY